MSQPVHPAHRAQPAKERQATPAIERPIGPTVKRPMKPPKDYPPPAGDPETLCALNSAILRRAAGQQGIDLSDHEVHLFERYAAHLVIWNGAINLTRLARPDEIAVQHILDSLMCLRGLAGWEGLDRSVAEGVEEGGPAGKESETGSGEADGLTARLEVADVGSGAGMPGLALAIVRPTWQVTLVESVAKKARFLEHVSTALELGNVRVVAERAEDFSRRADGRERFDLVTARAVAPLPMLAEYVLGLVRVGGRWIAMKGAAIDDEVKASAPAIRLLGGRLAPILPYALPSLDTRHLVIVDKVSATPSAYPRLTAAIKARPL